ncbi:MAG: lactonase family protein [Planctomycetaceae bacterium]|nr:lactonase family protein [Planctomycetaceae bacterium]
MIASRFFVFLLLMCGLLSGPRFSNAEDQMAKPLFLYCSAAKDRALVVLRMDQTTGAVTRLSSHATPGEPSALTQSPDRRYLFAAMRSTGQLASYRIAPETGALTAINIVDAGADPAQISTDHAGQHLFTAYYVAAKVSIHRIADNGSLSLLQELPTVEKAHAIGLDPSQRFAYVPHTGPNVIFQFLWNAETGRLAPHTQPKLQRPVNTGPRHLAWHPKLPIIYIDNEQGSSLTAYRPGRDGSLEPSATVSTLPQNFTGSNATAEIKVHPNGQFAYVSNRGHDSLAVVRLDEVGVPTELVAAEPTERTPRSFDITPDGRYLLAAGETSGRLAVNRIDETTGRLTMINTTPIGPMLWWVHVLR